jgi:NAD(P)H dehydrogenase (quinone)
MSKTKIAVIYYSTYGHVAAMAKEIMKGIHEAGGEGMLYQVRETLPDNVLAAMHAPSKDAQVPFMDHANISTLTEVDGMLFGFPTRFGMMPAQMKALWDATGGLWVKGALVGKPAGFFTSTASLHGGQETTIMTAVTQLTHHGMLYVPIGYSSPLLQNSKEVHGGSPWGAGCIAETDGSRLPSDLEKQVALHQGKHFAKIAAALKRGLNMPADPTPEIPVADFERATKI